MSAMLWIINKSSEIQYSKITTVVFLLLLFLIYKLDTSCFCMYTKLLSRVQEAGHGWGAILLLLLHVMSGRKDFRKGG